MSDTGIRQVSTTVDSRQVADDLARALVAARLAACVQVVGPIGSTYRWNGEVTEAQEWLLLMKTTTDRYPELERDLRARHPYDVPEIICVPVVAGAPDYLDWVRTGSGG